MLVPFLSVEGIPTSPQIYSVEGVNLTGKVTIKPPAGFEVSANNGASWFSGDNPLLLNPAGGILTATTIQLRMNMEVGTYSGNIKHFTEGSDTTYVFTSGTITSATAYPVSIIRWPMTSGNADDAVTRHPGLQPTLPAFKNLFLSNGTTVSAVPPYGSNHGQAFSPAADGSGLWTTASGGPGGTLRRTYYQEFTIVPKNGQSGIVDSIILNASFYNTESNTRFALVYSKSGFTTDDSTDISGGTGPDGQPLAAGANGKFSTPVLLPNQTASNTANYRFALNGAIGVALDEGGSLTIRMYFSCGSGSPGRYAKIKEVDVKGRMNNTLSSSGIFFNGVEQNGNIVLNWKTAASNEQVIYKVQRRTLQSEFSTLASVSTSPAAEGHYRYIDADAPAGIPLFYRLTFRDIFGNDNFSPTIFISRSVQPALKLYPNPVSTLLTLLHPAYEKPVGMQIIGADGSLRKQQTIIPFKSVTEVRVQDLRSGLYFIILSNGSQKQSIPFIKY